MMEAVDSSIPGAPAASFPAQTVPCNLLLVSDSRRWTRAVHAAAAEIGGGVACCDARGAVARLAGIAPRYSHLLLHPDSADGLLDELVTLTAGERDQTARILLLGSDGLGSDWLGSDWLGSDWLGTDGLGSDGRRPPRIGVIPYADRHAVRRALTTRPIEAFTSGDTPMHLTELREALAGTMVETRYQPIVRIADRQPVALEALVRLNHPVHGMVPPDAFVPQLEDAGLAAQLTDLVAERALADLAGPWLGAHALDLTLNFPLDVLLAPDALRLLDARRIAAGVAVERMIIELTESRPVEDLARLRRVLETLRADGYRISIDDVSPAVPHLDDLLELPFTSLKLDKSVVQAAPGLPGSRDFLSHVLQVARARHLTVIAEGVEDRTTWRRIAALGIDQAQGFLVARPLPATAVPIWLEAWRSQPAFG
jgi:EAL domain-containing protein (putative c-di-GMP-specific phosphodiesterase class I)